MRALKILFCCLLAATGLQAQRGGMGHGGFGGGFRGGGGFGGFRGGFGGFRGGFGGFRGGFGRFHPGMGFIGNRGFGFGRGFVGRGFWWGPRWGWGWGGGIGYYSLGGYYPDYPYAYGGYQPDYGYGSSPNVIVVYPQPQVAAAPAYSYQASPVISEYDEDGNRVARSNSSTGSGSPTYLIALKNNVIFDAVSYSVKGDTIYFVTIANEQKSSPLIMVDRSMSMRLNGERGVNFQLP